MKLQTGDTIKWNICIYIRNSKNYEQEIDMEQIKNKIKDVLKDYCKNLTIYK